jgi:hypothetical protein
MERTWVDPSGRIYDVLDFNLWSFCEEHGLHDSNFHHHINNPSSDRQRQSFPMSTMPPVLTMCCILRPQVVGGCEASSQRLAASMEWSEGRSADAFLALPGRKLAVAP